MRSVEVVRRAVSSFLAVPTGVIVGFVLLAGVTYGLDRGEIAWLRPIRAFMEAHVFGSVEATSSLLGTIAGGVITMTSITFSLLLLALQQSAGSMTHQVFDQFLRRRLNQVYFGFFIGMTLYALITLATVKPQFNPVFGATLALVLVMVALYILLLLIYSTINQMRPTEIIRSIHDYTLVARERQRSLIEQTRRAPALLAPASVTVTAPDDGFVVGIDLDAITQAIAGAPDAVEVEFLLAIGSYVAFHDPIARIRARRNEDATGVAEVVTRAVRIERARQLDTDPAYGIEQMEMIAWRSISTSQQNPAPGLIAIRNLRDILARWSIESAAEAGAKAAPIVYPDDAMSSLLAAFESLAVVASEAMQHQTYAEIVRTFAVTFGRLPSDAQRRVEDMILRTLSALGDHVLTAELDNAVRDLVKVLEGAGRFDTAAAVAVARAELATTIGKLNSRSTRVPSAG